MMSPLAELCNRYFAWVLALATCLACAAAQAEPDLQVTIVVPEWAAAGEDIGPKIKLEVRNAGSSVAYGTDEAGAEGYMVDVAISRDAALPAGLLSYSPEFQEDALLAGGRVSNTRNLEAGEWAGYPVGGGIPQDTPSGEYFICAVVDPRATVVEADESNNTDCRAINVKGYAPATPPPPTGVRPATPPPPPTGARPAPPPPPPPPTAVRPAAPPPPPTTVRPAPPPPPSPGGMGELTPPTAPAPPPSLRTTGGTPPPPPTATQQPPPEGEMYEQTSP
jgi:hypothetical protein